MLSYFYSVSYRKEEGGGGRSKLLADRARPLITFLPAPSSGQHQALAGHRQLKAARAALSPGGFGSTRSTAELLCYPGQRIKDPAVSSGIGQSLPPSLLQGTL